MDLNELKQKREQLDAEINTLQKENRSEAIKQIKELMANYNVTMEDLVKGAKRAKSTSKGKVAPKFKHAVTGATWTGRGKTPKWITDEPENVIALEAAGEPVEPEAQE